MATRVGEAAAGAQDVRQNEVSLEVVGVVAQRVFETTDRRGGVPSRCGQHAEAVAGSGRRLVERPGRSVANRRFELLHGSVNILFEREGRTELVPERAAQLRSRLGERQAAPKQLFRLGEVTLIQRTHAAKLVRQA